MKENLGKAIGAVSLTIIALIVGYGALSLPFKVFDNLTSVDKKIVFAVQMATILLVAVVYSTVRDKADKKAEEEYRQIKAMRHKEKRQQDFFDEINAFDDTVDEDIRNDTHIAA